MKNRRIAPDSARAPEKIKPPKKWWWVGLPCFALQECNESSNPYLQHLILWRLEKPERQVARPVHDALDAQRIAAVPIKDQMNSKPFADGK
jgi:hypothetical protein